MTSTSFYDFCIKNNKEYLLEEWDYDLNQGLAPSKLSYGSNKKVWWKCSYCGHLWKTSIYHRTIKNSGCPQCYHSKRKSFCKQDNLAITHPNLVTDWDQSRNGELFPYMFTKNSRYKVWWKCHLCGREVQMPIKNYAGCRLCKKKQFLADRNLTVTNQQIMEEWNYKRNQNINPEDFLPSSQSKVWWLCRKCGYEWQAKISNRTVLNRACPCCSNKVVVKGKNDLTTTHPDIAKEWHHTKNENLSPFTVTHGSGKKVWWICPNGHEYQATVLHRTQENGTGCPICNSGRQTSFAEQAVFYYVKKVFPDAISRYTDHFLGKMELDIFIPELKLAIEYDGENWHDGNEKFNREKNKFNICQKQGIKLIRLREKEPSHSEKIADYLWYIIDLYKHNKLEETIKELLFFIRKNYANVPYMDNNICINLEHDKNEILGYKTSLQKSLQDLYPNIAKEWHPTKNNNLKPDMFKPGSDHKVWWLCPFCGYEYEATIGKRTAKKNPTACPKCAIEKVTQLKRKAVLMIDPSSNQVINSFISISDASRKMGVNNSNISSACKGLRALAGGYKWRYKDN